MLQYDKIKNKKLRELLLLSASINSLPEDKGQQMIDNLASMSEAGQTEMIATLEEEQSAIKQAKIEAGITPEKELDMIKEKTSKVYRLRKEFDGTVRKEEEKEEKTETDNAAEELLKGLDPEK